MFRGKRYFHETRSTFSAESVVRQQKIFVLKMSLESTITSPHRRSNASSAFSSPTYRKRSSQGTEWESCSILLDRHRFLLTACVLLAFLCTIYLYFAVTLGADNSCSGLSGTQKASCHLEMVKASLAKGKLKVF